MLGVHARGHTNFASASCDKLWGRFRPSEKPYEHSANDLGCVQIDMTWLISALVLLLNRFQYYLIGNDIGSDIQTVFTTDLAALQYNPHQRAKVLVELQFIRADGSPAHGSSRDKSRTKFEQRNPTGRQKPRSICSRARKIQDYSATKSLLEPSLWCHIYNRN